MNDNTCEGRCYKSLSECIVLSCIHLHWVFLEIHHVLRMPFSFLGNFQTFLVKLLFYIFRYFLKVKYSMYSVSASTESTLLQLIVQLNKPSNHVNTTQIREECQSPGSLLHPHVEAQPWLLRAEISFTYFRTCDKWNYKECIIFIRPFLS